jgi:hypothetical protein
MTLYIFEDESGNPIDFKTTNVNEAETFKMENPSFKMKEVDVSFLSGYSGFGYVSEE